MAPGGRRRSGWAGSSGPSPRRMMRSAAGASPRPSLQPTHTAGAARPPALAPPRRCSSDGARSRSAWRGVRTPPTRSSTRWCQGTHRSCISAPNGSCSSWCVPSPLCTSEGALCKSRTSAWCPMYYQSICMGLHSSAPAPPPPLPSASLRHPPPRLEGNFRANLRYIASLTLEPPRQGPQDWKALEKLDIPPWKKLALGVRLANWQPHGTRCPIDGHMESWNPVNMQSVPVNTSMLHCILRNSAWARWRHRRRRKQI